MAYFNPLHHEGGDLLVTSPVVFRWISIHSTTRVETFLSCCNTVHNIISIHSTTRVETMFSFFLPAYHKISIHSTTRVETQ